MTRLCIISYLLAIVIANWAVSAYGQAALPLTAFILIPFDLVARDALHEKWRTGLLWPKMFLLISSGSVLSYVTSLSTGAVALASAVAFMLAGLVDLVVYHLLRNKHKLVKINGSNIASAWVDSLVFPLIAFGGINLMLSASQAASKVIGGLFWSFLFIYLTRTRQRCADCGCLIGFDRGPKDGWQLEDGRTVCQKCCVADVIKELRDKGAKVAANHKTS